MMRDIRSTCSTITFALSAAAWPSTSSPAIALARSPATFKGVPNSWAMPETSLPAVARRSAWRS